MKALIMRMQDWWDGRSLRERRLLALMLAGFAGVVLWLGVAQPVADAREEAADRRIEAERRLHLVETALVQRGTAAPAASPTDVQAEVAAAAQEAGVQPMLGMTESGLLGFGLDKVSTAQAFGWLAALEQRGVRVEELGVVKNPDGTLGVTGALSPGG